MGQYQPFWRTWQTSQEAFALRLFKPLSNPRRPLLGGHPGGEIMPSSAIRRGAAIADVQASFKPDLLNRGPQHRAMTLVPICQLSVIIPVYNEREGIEHTLQALIDFAHTHPTYAFIVVDDGSTDGTSAILRDRLSHYTAAAIQLVSYGANRGKGYAIHQGIQCAESDYVCFLDSDLAYSLDHLDVLFEALQTGDVVIGCRSLGHSQQQRIKFFRRLSGKVFNLLSRWILNLEFRDMQAGLKGFRRSAAQSIFAHQTLTGFSFDVELIYLAKKYGYRIGEIPAQVSAHHANKQSKVNLLKDSLRMLGDLLIIRYHDWLGDYD